MHKVKEQSVDVLMRNLMWCGPDYIIDVTVVDREIPYTHNPDLPFQQAFQLLWTGRGVEEAVANWSKCNLPLILSLNFWHQLRIFCQVNLYDHKEGRLHLKLLCMPIRALVH